jgi:hypothetical protein
MAEAALVTMLVQRSALPTFRKLQHEIVTRQAPSPCLLHPVPIGHAELTHTRRVLVLRRSVTAHQIQFARTVLHVVRAWLTNSRWGPLVAKAATVLLASASAAGGWALASRVFSTWRIAPPRAAKPLATPCPTTEDAELGVSSEVAVSTEQDVSDEQVVSAAEPELEVVISSSQKNREDGPSPVFEEDEEEPEHGPEEVVDTRTALRSVRLFQRFS